MNNHNVEMSQLQAAGNFFYIVPKIWFYVDFLSLLLYQEMKRDKAHECSDKP